MSAAWSRLRGAFNATPASHTATTFDEWSRHFIVRRMRLALLFLMFGNLAFLLLDRILHPIEFEYLVRARLLLSLEILPFWLMLFLPWAQRLGGWIIVLCGLILNVLFARSFMFEVYAAVTMFDVFAVSSYYLSLALANLTIAILVPVKLPLHVLTQVGMLAYYVAYHVHQGTFAGEREALFNDAFHGLWIFLAADALIFIQNRLLRDDFETRRRIELQNEELAAAYGKLSELDRLKSDFFANISHELRTPLTLVVGAFQSLQPALAGREAEIAAAGGRNAARLLVMINELLDLAKFERGAYAPQKRPFDAAALLRQVVGNFDGVSVGRRMTVEGAEAPVAIEADPRMLKKVLYNLLSNAVKFTDPKRGHISVSLRAGNHVQFRVADNGIGIPPDELKKIFDRFAQASGSTVKGFEGTGIGLALVKEIVDQHGGRIDVASELGRGTAFTLTLPRGDADESRLQAGDDGEEAVDELMRQVVRGAPGAAPPAQAATATATGAADSGVLVLLAEDNADLRHYLAHIVAKRYQVIAVEDGVQALAVARQRWPDVVLTDMMMPHMRGDELLRELRADPDLGDVPVIFLTAHVGAEARVATLRAGADDYLTKPFHEEELFARVDNLLKARRQDRDLRALNLRLEMRAEDLLQDLLRTGQLRRFVPRAVAEQIVSGDLDLSQPFVRRRITALFADLVGYTEMTAQLEPEEGAALLNEYLGEMSACVVAAGGQVDKFVGDALMALFDGATLGGDASAALAATRAAWTMQERMADLGQRWRRRGVPRDIRLRVGIHTGYVTLGVFGSDALRAYTAVGTPVNVAARLQSEAAAGEIVCGDATYVLIEDAVDGEGLGRFELRGIPHPVQAYRLRGMKPR